MPASGSRETERRGHDPQPLSRPTRFRGGGGADRRFALRCSDGRQGSRTPRPKGAVSLAGSGGPAPAIPPGQEGRGHDPQARRPHPLSKRGPHRLRLCLPRGAHRLRTDPRRRSLESIRPGGAQQKKPADLERPTGLTSRIDSDGSTRRRAPPLVGPSGRNWTTNWLSKTSPSSQL